MGVDQERRFEACLYDDIWTRLTERVSRICQNLFILRQPYSCKQFHVHLTHLTFVTKSNSLKQIQF